MVGRCARSKGLLANSCHHPNAGIDTLSLLVSNLTIMTTLGQRLIAEAEEKRLARITFPLPTLREQRLEAIQKYATDAYSRHGDWINFFREMLGPDGLIR